MHDRMTTVTEDRTSDIRSRQDDDDYNDDDDMHRQDDNDSIAMAGSSRQDGDNNSWNATSRR